MTFRITSYLMLTILLVTSCVDQKGKINDIDISKERINIVRDFIKNNNLNIEYAFFVRFDVHSGRKRMLLYNFFNNEIEDRFMCSHGSGSDNCDGTPCNFSNVPNSNASSEGLGYVYRRDYSNWGTHVKYWVKGLEHTNNNMERRIVVMHSYEGVPNEETYPDPIMNSEGCFMTSIDGMNRIDELMKRQINKKVAIYSYKENN